jgi:hypothetical protein
MVGQFFARLLSGRTSATDRLEAEVKAAGMTVFAHIDHAAGAAAVGKVWLTYNDPRWLAGRHGLAASTAGVVDAMGRPFAPSRKRPRVVRAGKCRPITPR